jgi:hypothetical protein
MRSTPLEFDRLSEGRPAWDAAAERGARRLWAAMMIARDVWVCESILLGRPVLAAHLDAEALRRALRGKPLPPSSEFIDVNADMLGALAEAGPFT